MIQKKPKLAEGYMFGDVYQQFKHIFFKILEIVELILMIGLVDCVSEVLTFVFLVLE